MADFRFMFSVLFFALLSFSCVNSRKYHVPVLVWQSGTNSGKVESFSSLAKLDSDQFLNHFLKRVHTEKPIIVLFVEETLSVEDFSSQDENRESSFPQLKKIKSTTKNFEYLPSVENPVSVLTGPEIGAYGYVTKDYLNNENLEENTIYTVKLEDAETMEDRPQLLQRHDKKIEKIYNDLLNGYDNVVAILAGRSASWVEPEEVIRIRRSTNTNTTGVVLQSNKTLLYTLKSPVLKVGDKEILLQNPITYPVDERGMFLRAIFGYSTNDFGNLKLRFWYENDTSSWKLKQIEFEAQNKDLVLETNQRIGTAFDRSYHVSGPVTFSNGSTSLTFENLQVQPWMKADQVKFSSADDSTPFFTPAIWTGIFVVGLLGLIMIWALTMIMDIRTMDQFDDPKGKTISVNVSE